MQLRSPVRGLALASAAALVAATLSATPAQAAPVFSESTLDLSADMHDDSSCTEGAIGASPDVNAAPITENGPAVNATTSVSGSVTDGAADTQTGSASLTVSAAVSSTGTDLKSIDLTAQGSVSVTNTVPVSTCDIHIYAESELDFTFTVTQPGFLTFTNKRRGGSMYTEFYVYGDVPSDSPYHDTYGEGMDVDTSDVIFLPAGTYAGYFTADMDYSGETAVSRSGSAAMKATFAPAGSQSAAAVGKGKKFVSLPEAARSCAADSVTASITGKAKRAKMIKKVKFFVNGKASAKVKKPKKGQSVVLAGIADGAEAEVRAVVKLAKKANGKKRNPVEVTSSYVACAPSA